MKSLFAATLQFYAVVFFLFFEALRYHSLFVFTGVGGNLSVLCRRSQMMHQKHPFMGARPEPGEENLAYRRKLITTVMTQIISDWCFMLCRVGSWKEITLFWCKCCSAERHTRHVLNVSFVIESHAWFLKDIAFSTLCYLRKHFFTAPPC